MLFRSVSQSRYLGFCKVQMVKVFSQKDVVELDCNTWTFKMKNKNIGVVHFDILYKSFYWNAFFSDGDIRRIKVNALPSVSESGIVFYGKTESAKSIPVDTWFTNLGFCKVQMVKVFSQTNVVELDCNTWTFKMKNKNIEVVDSYKDCGNTQEPFVRSFIEQLMGKNERPLNIPISNFLKVKELYTMALQKLAL